MFRLFLGLILAFFGAFAWANCEDKLTHGIVRGTLRLASQGVIGVAQIAEIANSETPVNPLRTQTPGSRNSAAGAFFKMIADAKLSSEQWMFVRNELKSALKDMRADAAIEDSAREETRDIHGFRLVNTGPNYTAAKGWSGFDYFEVEDKVVTVRNAFRKEEIWSAPIDTLTTYAGFSERNGIRTFNLVQRVTVNEWQCLRNFGRYEFKRTSVDLSTGSVTEGNFMSWRSANRIEDMEDILRYEDRPDGVFLRRSSGLAPWKYWLEVWKNGKMRYASRTAMRFAVPFDEQYYGVEYAVLPDGKPVLVGHQQNPSVNDEGSEVQFVMPRMKEPIRLDTTSRVYSKKIFVMHDGRVFVAVSVRRFGMAVPKILLFEPLKSREPIFKFYAPDVSGLFDIGMFENRNHLYLVASRFQADFKEGDFLYLFAPLEFSDPIVAPLPVPRHYQFHMAAREDGQIFVSLGGRGSLYTYSITRTEKP